MSRLAGFQNLFHGAQKTVRIFQHDPVKLVALVVGSGLFTLLCEEQLHGWSRRTLLMRNRE